MAYSVYFLIFTIVISMITLSILSINVAALTSNVFNENIINVIEYFDTNDSKRAPKYSDLKNLLLAQIKPLNIVAIIIITIIIILLLMSENNLFSMITYSLNNKTDTSIKSLKPPTKIANDFKEISKDLAEKRSTLEFAEIEYKEASKQAEIAKVVRDFDLGEEGVSVLNKLNKSSSVPIESKVPEYNSIVLKNVKDAISKYKNENDKRQIDNKKNNQRFDGRDDDRKKMSMNSKKDRGNSLVNLL